MSENRYELSPIWAEAVRSARDSLTDVEVSSAAHPDPPVSLQRDEIVLHKAYARYGTAGRWLVWSRKGPLYLFRTRNGQWTVGEDSYLCGETDESELAEWVESSGLRGARASTRQELLRIIRSALLEFE